MQANSVFFGKPAFFQVSVSETLKDDSNCLIQHAGYCNVRIVKASNVFGFLNGQYFQYRAY